MSKKVTAEIGLTYRAIVSGFEGLCVARATYLTGCDRAGIQSRSLDKDGKPQDAIWFDESELELVGAPKVTLDTDSTVSEKTRKGGPGRYDPPSR